MFADWIGSATVTRQYLTSDPKLRHTDVDRLCSTLTCLEIELREFEKSKQRDAFIGQRSKCIQRYRPNLNASLASEFNISISHLYPRYVTLRSLFSVGGMFMHASCSTLLNLLNLFPNILSKTFCSFSKVVLPLIPRKSIAKHCLDTFIKLLPLYTERTRLIYSRWLNKFPKIILFSPFRQFLKSNPIYRDYGRRINSPPVALVNQNT